MKQTYPNTNRMKFTDLTSSLRKSVLQFVNQYAGVFEALTRQQTPFGGSILTTNR